MRVCRICNKEKDINHFPKWKKTCKKCLSEYNKEWRRLNKSLKISECIAYRDWETLRDWETRSPATIS